MSALVVQAKLGNREWAPLDVRTFKKMVRDLPVTLDELSDADMDSLVRSLSTGLPHYLLLYHPSLIPLSLNATRVKTSDERSQSWM